ncbi:hypothetical protein [Phormidium tenue]|uniref:hypothetical protein n=1 Tax=Phormidium tenue TaxID=126344 RepID=UPI0015C57A40|nr:hypothetical protein [Phormidium tenue]MBD2232257.1 hypothetical protein [Phormidium tenue FACHB-1052]
MITDMLAMGEQTQRQAQVVVIASIAGVEVNVAFALLAQRLGEQRPAVATSLDRGV